VTDCRIKDQVYEMFGAEEEDIDKAMKGNWTKNSLI